MEGKFCLSRNFRLQKVGDINWLLNSYPFGSISQIIDELSIINLSRKSFNEVSDQYLKDVDKVISKVFIPLTLGGGLRETKDVEKLFTFGADKIQINHLLQQKNNSLITSLSKRYGNQSIIASIDVRSINGKYFTFSDHGKIKSFELTEFLNFLRNLNIGELNITSIDKDGTGQGYDLRIMNFIKDFHTPVIMSGGAGKPEHFLEVLKFKNISGVSTSNLFNFMGSSLKQAKEFLQKNNIQIRGI